MVFCQDILLIGISSSEIGRDVYLVAFPCSGQAAVCEWTNFVDAGGREGSAGSGRLEFDEESRLLQFDGRREVRQSWRWEICHFEEKSALTSP